MAKYLALIFVFVLAASWSSVSARPRHDLSLNDDIDKYVQWALKKVQDIPEPYKNRLENIFLEIKRKHWSSISNFQWDVGSAVKEVYKNELDAFGNSKEFYELVVRIVVSMTPPAYKSALKQKYEEALEKDYNDYQDFTKEAINIFEEVTGLDFQKYTAKYIDRLPTIGPEFWSQHFDLEEIKNYIKDAMLEFEEKINEETNVNESQRKRKAELETDNSADDSIESF